MKSIKSFVPNAISFLNLNSGVLAVIAALDGHLELSVGFVLLGISLIFSMA
jgi:phosphatidylserine synthase